MIFITINSTEQVNVHCNFLIKMFIYVVIELFIWTYDVVLLGNDCFVSSSVNEYTIHNFVN